MSIYLINISYMTIRCYLSQKNIISCFNFSFSLVKSRYYKIIGTYRSIFKTLKFSSKNTKFYIILLINSRKKNQKSTNFAFVNSLWKISYAYEVLYIHSALQEWNLSRMHNLLSLLNEYGLLSLMNDETFVVWGSWVLIKKKNKFLQNKIA